MSAGHFDSPEELERAVEAIEEREDDARRLDELADRLAEQGGVPVDGPRAALYHYGTPPAPKRRRQRGPR